MNGLAEADRFTVEQLIRTACGGAYPEEGEGLWWGADAFTFQSPWSTPWPEITAPGTPATDYGAWYVKDSGGASMPFFKSDDGTEYNLSTASVGSVNLNDLGDVSITSADSGDYVRYSGSAWVDVGIAQIITDLALDDIIGGSGVDVSNGADTIIGGNATVALGALTETWAAGGYGINCGTITIADGSSISLQEDITFTGATGVNLIKMPDNLADALSIQEGSNKYVTFNTVTDEEDIFFYKSVDILHTATHADDHALEIDTDAAAHGDVKAIDLDYITGGISKGEDEGIILVNIDETAAGDGEVFALEVLSTDGGASIHGMKVGPVVHPIHQDSGTFINPTFASDDTPSDDVAVMRDGLTTPVEKTTAIFEALNDYIIIGADAAFQDMELIFTTVSSKDIKPTFWYSIDGGSDNFTQFTPVDGTDGCRHTGVISWDASDLTDHVADDTTGKFDIKIIRTKGGSFTTPVLGYAKTATTVEYVWDQDGDVEIRNLIISDAGNIGSASDPDAMQIEADGDIVMSQGLAITGALSAASVTASGTVQAEHLYTTDDLVVDGLATIGETLKVGNTAIDPDAHNNSVVLGTIADGGGWSGVGIGMHEGTGAGDTASIVLTSNIMYFGLGDGSAANSLSGYMNLTNAGLLSLPTAGSSAGLLMGGDFHIYRSAANVGYTPDSFQVNTNFSVGVAPSSLYEGYFYRASAGDAQIRVTNPTDGTGSSAVMTAASATSAVSFYAFPANYTVISVLADKGGIYAPASSSALFFWKSGNAAIEFYTNSTKRMEIQGDGTLWQGYEFHLDADLNHDGTNVGFYGTAPVAQQAGVAVTAAAVHAALVNLGLITA